MAAAGAGSRMGSSVVVGSGTGDRAGQRAATRAAMALACAAMLGVAAPLVAQGPPRAVADVKLPYWASISEDVAWMRKGPSPDVPVIWEYRRRDLPVRVIAVHENWRKVEDPDGTVGWMNARLLSRVRAAIVTGEVRPIREDPSADAAILYRAEPGVVGRISDCTPHWCRLDVTGRGGWISTDHIWGD